VTIEAIENGHYVAKANGGLPVGEHRVEILAYDLSKSDGKWPAGPGVPVPPQILPAKYNTRSQLTVSVERTGSELTRDFQLTL
jgi:hypothetical protein